MPKDKKLMSATRSGRKVYRPSKLNTSSSEEVICQKAKKTSNRANMVNLLKKLKKMAESAENNKTSPVPPTTVPVALGDAGTSSSFDESSCSQAQTLDTPPSSRDGSHNDAGSGEHFNRESTTFPKIVQKPHTSLKPSSNSTTFSNCFDTSRTGKITAEMMDEDEDLSCGAASPKKHSTPRSINVISSGNADDNIGNHEQSGSAIINLLTTMSSEIKNLNTQNQQIMTQNSELKKSVDVLTEELRQAQLAGVTRFDETLLQPMEGFPLSSLQDFENMEAEENTEIRENLFKHFTSLGGSTAREFLSCSMRQVMTDEFVASQFTWDGSKGKIEFRKTRICNILYLAAKKCTFEGPRDKVAFKNDMKEILRATKQRHKNAGRRNSKNKQNKSLPGLETEDEFIAQIDELKRKLGVIEDDSFSEAGSGGNRSNDDDEGEESGDSSDFE